MPYATQQDIIDRYTEDQLLIVATHPDSTDGIDVVRVSTALDDASEEIDGYLGRYRLPLESPYPRELIRRTCDIAMFLLPVDGLQLTDKQIERYNKTVKWLEAVKSGDVELNLPVVEGETTTSGAATITSAERLFTRDSMRGVS